MERKKKEDSTLIYNEKKGQEKKKNSSWRKTGREEGNTMLPASFVEGKKKALTKRKLGQGGG